MAEFSDLRYCHKAGLLQLARDKSPNSNQTHFLSCGYDGVRIWGDKLDIDDDDSKDYRVGEKATALCWHGDMLYAGCNNDDRHTVQGFTFGDGEAANYVGRSSLQINCLDINRDGKYIAQGSSDMDVKVINLSDCSNYKRFSGHDGPILSVTFDPKDQFVMSSSTDGNVKIWDFKNEKDDNCIKTLSLLTSSNDSIKCPYAYECRMRCCRPFRTLAKCDWTSDGEYLLIPTKSDVKVYRRKEWTQIRSLDEETLNEETYSLVVLSPCGRYLAASTLNGHFIVWEWTSGRRLCIEQHPSKLTVCALIWHPGTHDQLIFCDIEGNIGALRNVLAGRSISPTFCQLKNEIDDDVIDDVVQASRSQRRMVCNVSEETNNNDLLKNSEEEIAEISLSPEQAQVLSGKSIENCSLFDPSLIRDLEKEQPELKPTDPDLIVRPLRIGDYERGYLELLSQLTLVGSVSREKFIARFETMQSKPQAYYIFVIEHRPMEQVVGSATLFLEWKMIHEAGFCSRVEDVIASSSLRGKGLGKILLGYLVAMGKSLGCYKISLECKDWWVRWYEMFGGFNKDSGNNFMVQRCEAKTIQNPSSL